MVPASLQASSGGDGDGTGMNGKVLNGSPCIAPGELAKLYDDVGD